MVNIDFENCDDMRLKSILVILSLVYSSAQAQTLFNRVKFADALEVERTRHFPYVDKLGFIDNGVVYENGGSTATLRYKAIDAYQVAVIIYNTQGSSKKVFDNLPSGIGQVKFDKTQFASGTYICALAVNGRIVKKNKILL